MTQKERDQILLDLKKGQEERDKIFGTNLSSDEKHKYRLLIGNIRRREKCVPYYVSLGLNKEMQLKNLPEFLIP